MLGGCKPKSSTDASGSPGPAAYFKTPFQDESQFIVEAIVSDLAEQIYYAAYHRLPDEKSFSVLATEKPGSPQDAPIYELQIQLDPKVGGINSELNVNGPIWSPSVYEGLASSLAKTVALNPGPAGQPGDTTLLAKLLDGTAETIERENQDVSAALEGDFGNPLLHEQAALLLGAFLMRDHSGNFYAILPPLSRLTAHLAMAHFLRGTDAEGVNGRMAETMMLTLVGDEADALRHLDTMSTSDAAVAAFARALRIRNTGDYRPLDALDGLSRVEIVEWFMARSDYVDLPQAWQKLSDDQKQTIDFVRAANQEKYSVEVGHQLLDSSIPLELNEIRSVYGLYHQKQLGEDGLVDALNALPERCFGESDGNVHVRVIGWGQWADFFQRHLCYAIQQNYYFMSSMWGVPDDARQFAEKCEQSYGGLRLYPFVRRFNCSDERSYHEAVDDAFKVTVDMPQLVPAECWNYLCYQVSFAAPYNPNPNPHINEWHKHNPPPGTVYDLYPRLNHPSLVGRADALPRFEQLHEMAPYDCRIINFIQQHKYNGTPTYEEATNLFKTVLPYATYAMACVANTVTNQPARYEELMEPAAELNPAYYYDLGYYEDRRQEADKAAHYYDLACNSDPDSVRAASLAPWRVKYYLKKGQTDRARHIADDAGEVYSARGLTAKATFFELTSNYDGAFEWYAKDEERYGDSKPLLQFCLRYKQLTGDNRFEPEIQKRIKKYFPEGMQTVTLADFHDAPKDGVLINQQTELLTGAGLLKGDVIVALNGTRTHTFNEYTFLREALANPEMDLIVWQGTAYHEIKAAPPNHLFGADFRDYKTR